MGGLNYACLEHDALCRCSEVPHPRPPEYSILTPINLSKSDIYCLGLIMLQVKEKIKEPEFLDKCVTDI